MALKMRSSVSRMMPYMSGTACMAVQSRSLAGARLLQKCGQQSSNPMCNKSVRAHQMCVSSNNSVKLFHTARPLSNKYIINIQDEEDFQKQVLQSKTPVIVDFHADWCGPCKTLGPRLESLIAAKDGKVILAKVDVDQISELAMEYKVQAIPTVISVKNGKVHDTFVGVKDDAGLESFINAVTLE